MLLASVSARPTRRAGALAAEAPAAATAAAGRGQEAESAQAREFERRMRREVSRFGFEEPAVVGPNQTAMPGEWERHLEYVAAPGANEGSPSPGRFFGRYPDFLAVEIVQGTPPESVHGGLRALRMSLAGSAEMDLVAVKRRYPLDVNPDRAYRLTGWARLEGASKSDSYARLGIEWVDEADRRVGEIRWSDKVTVARSAPGRAWTAVPELHINDVPAGVHAARIWCEASGHEPEAWASFDDIELHSRPKVRVRSDPPESAGIFAAGEVPALHLGFLGLDPPGASATSVLAARAGRYVRSVAIEDLFGRRYPVADREFGARDIRDGGIEERLLLEMLDKPGAYSVRISLATAGPFGLRSEVASRVLRLVKLGGEEGASSFGVETGLYGPDAPRLLSAIGRLEAPVAVRLGREDRVAAADAGSAPRGELTPEDRLARTLRDLAHHRVQVEGVLAPVSAQVRDGFQDWKGAGTLYESERWRQVLGEMAGPFLQQVGSWRLAAAADGSLGALGLDGRMALAGRVREGPLETAPGKTIGVPVALGGEGLAAPAPAIAGEYYRDLVFVPAATTPEQLTGQLGALFPPGGAANAGQGRDWFIELDDVSENLTLSMEAERRQAQELARKAVALVVAGAGRCFTELSDPRRGLLGPELNPRPAYAAWRTLGQYLGGAECLGTFDLVRDPDVHAWAFRRGDQGLVVFWSDGARREVAAQLGTRGRTELVDITGERRGLRAPRSMVESGELLEAEMVPVSPMPAILVGLDPALIRTRQSFQLAAGSKMECLFEAQPVVFELRNHFKTDLSASIFPRFPQGSAVLPRFQKINIKPGESARIEFSVRPSFVETMGEKDVTVDLQLYVGDRRETFTVCRAIGYESMLTLSFVPPTPDRDGRTARLQISAGVKAGIVPDRKLTDLEVSLSIPGQGRQRKMIEGVATGKSRQLDEPFTVVLGAKPRTIYAGVRERNGSWFGNLEIEVPAATPPRYADRR